jgi:ABC-type Fe3+ transport system permease subunit
MENYSREFREWVPVVPTSSWRVACGLAAISVLLDVVALMIANATDSLKCSDGWTDAGQNLKSIAFLVVPVTLAAVVAGVYAARRRPNRLRRAAVLITSVLVAAGITLVASSALLNTGPFRPCSD